MQYEMKVSSLFLQGIMNAQINDHYGDKQDLNSPSRGKNEDDMCALNQATRFFLRHVYKEDRIILFFSVDDI